MLRTIKLVVFVVFIVSVYPMITVNTFGVWDIEGNLPQQFIYKTKQGLSRLRKYIQSVLLLAKNAAPRQF